MSLVISTCSTIRSSGIEETAAIRGSPFSASAFAMSVTLMPCLRRAAANALAACPAGSLVRGPGDPPASRPSSTHRADVGVTWSPYPLGQVGFQAGPVNRLASYPRVTEVRFAFFRATAVFLARSATEARAG